MENVRIFALGGQDENGKNSYVFAYNEDLYLINCGVKIPVNSENGVDTLIPNFEYLEKNKKNFKGVFISDIRNESFSALPWLLMKIPGLKIYTSEFSKDIIIERLSKYNIKPTSYKIIVLTKKKKIGDIYIQPISLSGSVPGNLGFSFITKTGDYVFMFNYIEGDLGIFGRSWFLHLPKLFSKRKVKALISDAGKTNFAGKANERAKLPESILNSFRKAKKNERIIFGSFSEDMFSLQLVLELALKHNRPVAIYGKSYWDLLETTQKILVKQKIILALPKLIYYKDISKYENAVVLVTGSAERLYNRLLRIVVGEDIYLKFKPSDHFIMNTPLVNGLESLVSYTLDEIARITPNVTEVSDLHYFYARPFRDDIVSLVKNLAPEYFLPAQGLFRYLTDCANWVDSIGESKTKSIVLLNGKILHFVDGVKFSQNAKIKDVKDVIIDGFGVGDISSEVIAEREVLGREGVIIINALYNPKTRQIVSHLNIKSVGVVDEAKINWLYDLIKQIVIDLISERNYASMYEVNEKIRKTIRKKIFKLTDKDPLVALTLTQV